MALHATTGPVIHILRYCMEEGEGLVKQQGSQNSSWLQETPSQSVLPFPPTCKMLFQMPSSQIVRRCAKAAAEWANELGFALAHKDVLCGEESFDPHSPKVHVLYSCPIMYLLGRRLLKEHRITESAQVPLSSNPRTPRKRSSSNLGPPSCFANCSSLLGLCKSSLNPSA